MSKVLDSAPSKTYPYDVDPDYPVFVTGITLTANQEKDMDIPPFAVMIFVEMVKNGVAVGDVSIALGERGDFWDVAPGDKLEVSHASRMRMRNNTGAVKTFKVLHSLDRRFSLTQYPRGS